MLQRRCRTGGAEFACVKRIQLSPDQDCVHPARGIAQFPRNRIGNLMFDDSGPHPNGRTALGEVRAITKYL
jgi:hypothetical protein